jgi:hypothetical protein
MALQKSRPHDVKMDTLKRIPRIGDQVRIAGFSGRFEVVKVEKNGSMADLKHLDVPGPDYIERDILRS